jgi:hypothetical protein
MTMHTIWLLIDSVGIIVIFVAIAVAASSPLIRSFIPGLVLLGVGIVCTLLRELGIIPRQYWLAARIVYVPIAILGAVLVEREWAKVRSRGRRDWTPSPNPRHR